MNVKDWITPARPAISSLIQDQGWIGIPWPLWLVHAPVLHPPHSPFSSFNSTGRTNSWIFSPSSHWTTRAISPSMVVPFFRQVSQAASGSEGYFTPRTCCTGHWAGIWSIGFTQTRYVEGNYHILLWTADLYTDDPAHRLVPKLVSLTLSRLDFLHGVVDDTLDFLQGRRNRKIGLKRLVIQSCRVHRDDDESLELEDLVKVIKWIDSEEMGSNYEGSDGGLYSDGFGCYPGAY
jgi:hypothetical protein